MSGESITGLARLKAEFDKSLLRVALGHFRRPVDQERFLEFVSGIERIIPSEFKWLSHEEKRIPLQDRRTLIEKAINQASEGGYFLIDNGQESDADFVGVKFFSVDTATDATVVLSPRFSTRMPEILGLGGDAFECRWAEWTPPPESLIMHYQLFQAWKTDDARSPGFLPSHPDVMAFPRLRLPQFRDHGGVVMDNHLLPTFIGWINYWSAEVCEKLGFPDNRRDEALLKLSHQTKRGAWLVRLTERMLDFRLNDHRQMVEWAYDRFRAVGARA